MHLAPLIQDLAIILAIAAVMSLLFRRIRQPVVLGYLLAGIIVGPFTPPFQLVTDIDGIRIWAELGVIFLMFTLGLEFSFRKLAKVGASAVITAGTEVAFFIPVGYFVGQALDWSPIESLFLGAMLSMSSTTIIIKAVDELKLKTYRFAELVFATLIVEDLIAILLLVGLSTIALTQTIATWELFLAAMKMILIVGGWIIAGYFIVPRFLKYIGGFANNEMITLVSLGLCLGLVVIATRIEYSSALGAFIMGSILAETPLLHRIEERMESLRDLFGAVFFVSVGMLIDPIVLWNHRSTVAILCIITIVGKIISTSFGALISGQSFKNSVRVGFGLAQIGEFSFIIATLGVSLKAIGEHLYPIIVAVSLVTTFTTPYLIRVSSFVADRLEQRLPKPIRMILNRYAAWGEERRTRGASNKEFRSALLKWLVNALVVAIIFIAGQNLLSPWLSHAIDHSPLLGTLIAWVVSAAISAPFIWAMLTIFKRYYDRQNLDRVSAMIRVGVSRVAAMLLVASLSARFIPGKYAILLFLAAVIVFFGIFRKSLDIYYHWYERKFVSGIGGVVASEESPELGHLAPWDAHFVKVIVHPNSEFSGNRLAEAGLRTRFGVNIVAIRRGADTIIPPDPRQQIFPGDELILLGTDEEVERVRGRFEGPLPGPQQDQRALIYELRNFRISDKTELAHRTIRQSGIREVFNCMVVGLERGLARNINPDSDVTLIPGDTIWMVGDKQNLDRFAEKLTEKLTR